MKYAKKDSINDLSMLLVPPIIINTPCDKNENNLKAKDYGKWEDGSRNENILKNSSSSLSFFG